MTRIHAFVETAPDQLIVESIFRDEAGIELKVSPGMTSSGAISLAEASLLQHPEVPVALIFNLEPDWGGGEYVVDERKVREELRDPIHRILARIGTAPHQLAIAIPRLDAWAMRDPQVKAAFEQNPKTRGFDRGSYRERAQLLRKLTESHFFDKSALHQADAEFRALHATLSRWAGIVTMQWTAR